MKRSTSTRLATVVVALAALAMHAGPTLARPATPAGADLATVRAATARYHDVQVALDDGYVPVSDCEEIADGAMGVHYLNPALAADGEVDPTRPEVLLYMPGPTGTRLVGVEYFVAEAAAGGFTPTLFGVPFDGPMDGHSEGMPRHYDLHVWTWRHNPAGMVASWNPALRCPA